MNSLKTEICDKCNKEMACEVVSDDRTNFHALYSCEPCGVHVTLELPDYRRQLESATLSDAAQKAKALNDSRLTQLNQLKEDSKKMLNQMFDAPSADDTFAALSDINVKLKDHERKLEAILNHFERKTALGRIKIIGSNAFEMFIAAAIIYGTVLMLSNVIELLKDRLN